MPKHLDDIDLQAEREGMAMSRRFRSSRPKKAKRTCVGEFDTEDSLRLAMKKKMAILEAQISAAYTTKDH